MGAAFGATRALSLLPARAATDPDGLVRLHDRLDRAEAPARRAVVLTEAVAIGLLIAGLL